MAKSRTEKGEEIVVARGVSWVHLVACAFATALCTVLAAFAVLAVPVPPAPGVSALYIAAGVYVPVSLWLGLWGCIAGYLSCVLMGLWVTPYSLPFLILWSFCDFAEGLVPLLVFRLFKVDLDFRTKATRYTNAMLALVVLGTAVLTIGTAFGIYPIESIYLGTALAVVGIFLGLFTGKAKTWISYVVFGIVGASIASGIIGAGVLCWWYLGMELFPIVFTGWVIGDMVVLATVGTSLMVIGSPFITRTTMYVRKWLS